MYQRNIRLEVILTDYAKISLCKKVCTRPPHIYVKVKTADGLILTTQLYFPNAPVSKELILDVKQVSGTTQATFNFVL